MTTAEGDTTSARRPERPARSARPFRIGFRRRRELRRLGRGDGAVAVPALRAVPPGLTTDVRAMLTAALFAAVAGRWEAYFVDRTGRQSELSAIDVRLALLRSALSEAQVALDAAGDAVPDLDVPQPGPGEAARGRSADLLARRRRRAYEQVFARLSRRRDGLQVEVQSAEQARARLTTLDSEQRHLAAVDEQRMIATCIFERTIYDRALVRRHPDGRELDGRLDRTPPPQSGWARDSLREGI